MPNDFFDNVYTVVRRIPEGKVTTFGAIARYLGAGRSARMVGYALGAVSDEMSIPCHRVVNRNGELSGKIHFPTPTFMQDMLESEGVPVHDDRVELTQHFWDPVELDAPPSPRRGGKRS